MGKKGEEGGRKKRRKERKERENEEKNGRNVKLRDDSSGVGAVMRWRVLLSSEKRTFKLHCFLLQALTRTRVRIQPKLCHKLCFVMSFCSNYTNVLYLFVLYKKIKVSCALVLFLAELGTLKCWKMNYKILK